MNRQTMDQTGSSSKGARILERERLETSSRGSIEHQATGVFSR
jgi:hypothetical protein